MQIDVRAGAAALALGIGLGVGAALATAAPASADSADAHSSGPTTHRVAPAAARGTAKPVMRRDARPRAAVQTGATAGPSIKPTALSPYALSSGTTTASELSGLTYAGGTTYYSVGDNGADSIWQVYTSVTSTLGGIRSGFVDTGITAPALGRDSEGIALTPSGSGVWVSDEIASTITEFSLSDGAKTGSVEVPSIYRPANVQGDFGLESLAYGAGALWTANEEALRTDGALSTTTAGSWVRIQKFNGPDFAPASQYAYRTDPIAELSPLIDVERSGLVDMVALPDGQVLTLERELGGFLPIFRSRIYQVGLTEATDVAVLPSLSNGGFTPATKTLLWEGYFAFTNFEGITLGPRLSDGSYTMLLVSDDGSGELAQRQSLLSLTLCGVTTA